MKAITARRRPTHYATIALIPVLALLALLIAFRLVSPVLYTESDFFTFWLAGRLAITGGNPYSSQAWIAGHHLYGATWIANSSFLYPIPLSLVFAPLGLLPIYPAYVVWVTLSQLMIVASGALLLRPHPPSLVRYYLLPLAAGTAIFRPTILALLNGQVTALVLLVLAGVVYLWREGKWWQGSLLLSLLVLKPNLGVPLIAMLSLYLLIRRRFSALLWEGAGGLALLLVGILQNAHWIGEYVNVGSAKLETTFGASPTVWGVSGTICHYNLNCTVPPAALAALLLLAGYVYLLVKSRDSLSPAWAAGFAVTVVLLVTPYTWQYDQLLLLIPIISITMGLAASGVPFLPNALIFIALDILAFVLLWMSGNTGNGVWFVFIPLCVLALAAWAFLREERPIAG